MATERRAGEATPTRNEDLRARVAYQDGGGGGSGHEREGAVGSGAEREGDREVRWEIRLFGGLAAARGPVALPHLPEQADQLLAYLAYHLRHSHPRDLLIEQFWPECDRDSGRARLSNAIWALRRALEPPGVPEGSVLRADRESVGLN